MRSGTVCGLMRLLLTLTLVCATQAHAERWLELQLVPVSAQVNVLETEHAGSGGRATFHFNRFIGVYVGGLYNWHTGLSPALQATDNLTRFRLRTQPEPALPLATWQVHAGVESIPFIGTFTVGGKLEGSFGLVASLGLGAGGSRAQLREPSSPTVFADSETRFMGHFGFGTRFAFGAFAIHLGLHGALWSGTVTRLNGCSIDDFRAQGLAQRGGEDPALASVSAGCRFDPALNPDAGRLALQTGPGVRLNLAAELGLSWSL